jgi:hypothetical protein
MLDESLLEIMGDDFGLEKHWQWLYRVEHSSLWNITHLYMTKPQFVAYMQQHNQQCPRNPIVEFGKAKITKRYKGTVEQKDED